jgi:cellulose synthase/poly-beta-1,6-N-acetylglucosamine synthase-like glycosyltransferase
MTVIDIMLALLTYGIFAYATTLLSAYIIIGLASVGESRKYLRKNEFSDFRLLASSPHAPSVSILAPAYNEGATIIENVRSLLSLYYSTLEVVVINDGSKDDCLQKLIEGYDLEKVDFHVQYKIATK